jgi:hypothetical protein
MSNLGGVRVNFTKLEVAHPALAAIIRRETMFYKHGWRYVSLDLLTDIQAALALKNFVTIQQDSMADVEPPPPPPAVAQVSMEDVLREQQADMDTRAARAELDRLVAEEYLEPTDKNMSEHSLSRLLFCYHGERSLPSVGRQLNVYRATTSATSTTSAHQVKRRLDADAIGRAAR